MPREIPTDVIEKPIFAIIDRVGDYLLPSGALKARHRASHVEGARDEQRGLTRFGAREIEAEARVLTGVARSGLEEKPRMWDTRFAEGGGHNLGAGHGFLRRVAQGAAACSR
nr:hypothetical protein [Thioclava electrotropha]